MRFCVSCGYQNPLAGGAGSARMAAAPASNSKPSYLVIFSGVLALLVIAGLVGFIVLRGSGSSAQDDAPAPRAKTVANTSAAASPVAPTTASAPSASAPTATATPAVAAAAPVPPTAPKATPKPVNCDKKCYKVYDSCMAEYRQFEDVENICRGKQSACLGRC